MTFPKLKLTPYESASINKYSDPRTAKRGVLRRVYPGFLALTQTQRQPVFPFQIARRCRVFAFTCVGDVDQFLLEIIDVTGEKHTANPVPVNMLFPGTAANVYGKPSSPLGAATFDSPYNIDPNIVLLPNQTLTMRGYQTQPYVATNYRIDFCLHVWEFPGMEGSPT